MDEQLAQNLRALIREVIIEQLDCKLPEPAQPTPAQPAQARASCPSPLDIRKDPSGFALIRSTKSYERFDTGKSGDKVTFRQLLTAEDSPNLAFGFLDIEESSFDWYLGYDEVDYILHGTWEVTIDDKTYVGQAGDTMFIPRNTAVTFSSPDHATVFYAAYPANWEELCEEQP